MNGQNTQAKFTLQRIREKFSNRRVFLHHWPEREIDDTTIKMLKVVNCELVDYIDKSVAYVLTTLTNKEVEHLRTYRKSGSLSDSSLNDLVDDMLSKGFLQSPKPKQTPSPQFPKSTHKQKQTLEKESPVVASIATPQKPLPSSSNRKSSSQPLMSSSPKLLRSTLDLEKIVKAFQLHICIMPMNTLWKWIHHTKQKEVKLVGTEKEKRTQDTSKSTVTPGLRVAALVSPAIKLSHVQEQFATMWHEKGTYMASLWYRGSANTSDGIEATPPTVATANPVKLHATPEKFLGISGGREGGVALLPAPSPAPSTCSQPSKSLQMYSAEPVSRDLESAGDHRRMLRSGRQPPPALTSSISLPTKNAPKPISHFCDCCHGRYECILEHLQSEKHITVVQTQGLYDDIDALITTLPPMHCVPSPLVLVSEDVTEDSQADEATHPMILQSCPVVVSPMSVSPPASASPPVPILRFSVAPPVHSPTQAPKPPETLERLGPFRDLDASSSNQGDAKPQDREMPSSTPTTPMVCMYDKEMSVEVGNEVDMPAVESYPPSPVFHRISDVVEPPSPEPESPQYEYRFHVCSHCNRMHVSDSESSPPCVYMTRPLPPVTTRQSPPKQSASPTGTRPVLSPTAAVHKSPLPHYFRITKTFKHQGSTRDPPMPCTPRVRLRPPTNCGVVPSTPEVLSQRKKRHRKSRSIERKPLPPCGQPNTGQEEVGLAMLSPSRVSHKRRRVETPGIVRMHTGSCRRAKDNAHSRIFIQSVYGNNPI